MPEFLDFGKNSAFILICYGISFVVLSFLVLMTLRAKRRARQQLAKIESKQA